MTDLAMAQQLFHIWSERPLTTQQLAEYSNELVLCGTAADTPDRPFADVGPADAIIAGGGLIYSHEVLAMAPRLRVVARTGIGCDNVDVGSATDQGIAVCNTPDVPTRATAEYTIAMILAAAKQLKPNDQALAQGRKIRFFDETNALDLLGATLGIVGMGRIGKLVARLAGALGMQVIACDPFVRPSPDDTQTVEFTESLNLLLASSDIVTLHVPLTDETRELIGREQLACMKAGSYLINCARGGVVDEKALVAALDAGHLAGAAVDTFTVEPPPADHPLVGYPNIVATPHVAAATMQCKIELVRAALKNAVAVLQGHRPKDCVNPEVLERSLSSET